MRHFSQERALARREAAFGPDQHRPLVAGAGRWRDRVGVVVAERGSGRADAIAPAAGAGDEWTVLVGPEGGFAPSERALLGEMPHLGLGPHVLKAETAPIAAVAILIERAGRVCRE